MFREPTDLEKEYIKQFTDSLGRQLLKAIELSAFITLIVAFICWLVTCVFFAYVPYRERTALIITVSIIGFIVIMLRALFILKTKEADNSEIRNGSFKVLEGELVLFEKEICIITDGVKKNYPDCKILGPFTKEVFIEGIALYLINVNKSNKIYTVPKIEKTSTLELNTQST